MRKIKCTLLILSACLVYSLGAYAQGNDFSSAFDAPGQRRSSVSVYGTFLSYLYGYNDQRYVNKSDQGAYLAADSYSGGVSVVMADFGTLNAALSDCRMGANVAFSYKDSFQTKSLYAVPSLGIPQESRPPSTKNKSFFTLYPGFFMGIDRKWYSIDGGLTLCVRYYDEKHRDYYAPDGSIVKAKGSGWLSDYSSVFLNFAFRLGSENGPHFIFDFMNRDYDAVYGLVNTKICIPLVNNFSIAVGSFLYPAESLYLEPSVIFSGVTLSLRGGTMINYYKNTLKRVGLQDSSFCRLSLSYQW